MPCSSRASTIWGACCCLLNDISQAQAQLHASARLQPPSLLLSQVFLMMTPLPAVIWSAKLLQADGRTYGTVPCQRIGRAPPPVKLVPFCFGHPCSPEFFRNSRMPNAKLRKTVLTTGAKIEAEIRAPFLFHCHNAANSLSPRGGLAF